MLVITLPHLLGIFVHYHHGYHTAKGVSCPSVEFCNSTSIPRGRLLNFCSQDRKISLSCLEQQAYNELKKKVCLQTMEQDHKTNRYECHIQPVFLSQGKFNPSMNVLFQFQYTPPIVRVCNAGARKMKYDPDFLKTVYLGIDLPLRYAIPCCALIFINVALVVTLRKVQQRHSNISQTATQSLFNLPALRNALGISFAFLICHTGGAGLFVLNVPRAFVGRSKGIVGTTANVFVEDSTATKELEMKYSALLLAALNSSVNIVLFCFFLPTFRNHWSSMFTTHHKKDCHTGPYSTDSIPEITTLEEMELPRLDKVSTKNKG